MGTPDFILSLRQRIGHEPLWLMGATLLCLRDGELGQEVFLQRRADDGLWAPISGIVEPGEHPTATLRREALEEVDAEVEVGRMLWCLVGEPIVYANHDQTRYLDHGYVGRITGGSLRPDGDEVTQCGWFPIDELPRPCQAQLPRLVAIAVEDARDVVASLDL